MRQQRRCWSIRLRSTRSTPKPCLRLVACCKTVWDIDGALAQYRVAVHLHPDSPQVRRNFTLVKVLYRVGVGLERGAYGADITTLDVERACFGCAHVVHAAHPYKLLRSSVQVWNNVGLCFFGKQRYIAAIACLKRALYLGPFEWIVCYNLGLVHIHTEQYASAFNSFSAAINLKPSFAHTYMYLGITLARLGDFDNACHAYARAIEKNGQDAMFRLNYGAQPHTLAVSAAYVGLVPLHSRTCTSQGCGQKCCADIRPSRHPTFARVCAAITLYQGGDAEQARAQFKAFQELRAQLSPEDRDADAEMPEQATLLLSALG